MTASEIVTSPPGGENSYQVVQSDGFFLEGRIITRLKRKPKGPRNGAQHRLHRCALGRKRLNRRYAGRRPSTQAHSLG